jgi:hypothetical protein
MTNHSSWNMGATFDRALENDKQKLAVEETRTWTPLKINTPLSVDSPVYEMAHSCKLLGMYLPSGWNYLPEHDIMEMCRVFLGGDRVRNDAKPASTDIIIPDWCRTDSSVCGRLGCDCSGNRTECHP